MSHITSFFQAVQAGDARRVKALLDSHASLATAKSEKGQSALLTAVYSWRKEIRDLLLARGVELELHEAVAAGQLERVKQIVDKGPALAKSNRRTVFLSSPCPQPLVIWKLPSTCSEKARK